MPELNLPNPQSLAEAFAKDVWQPFGNVTSPALIKAWSIIFDTYNQCITDNKMGLKPVKYVVPNPTGSGKTLALAYYCAKLNTDYGSLIVTAFKDSADEIESNIQKNRTIGTSCETFHEDSKLKITNNINALKDVSSLIITHQKYINAIDQDNDLIKSSHNKFDNITRYMDSARSLIAIDESISSVKYFELTDRSLSTLIHQLKDIECYLNAEQENERKDISNIITGLDNLKEFITKCYSDAGKDTDNTGSGLHVDKAELRSTFYNTYNEINTLIDILDNNSISDMIDSIDQEYEVKARDKIISNLIQIKALAECDHVYYLHNGKYPTLHACRSILPNNFSCVILDATASIDSFYEMAEGYLLAKLPTGLRNYSHVTLTISTGHAVGQRSTVSKEVARDLIEEVNDLRDMMEISNEYGLEPLTAETKNEYLSLIVTHKSAKESFNGSFEKLKNGIDVNHYGNLTGKNDYRDHCIIMLAGFPYKPTSMHTDRHLITKRSSDAIPSIENYKTTIISPEAKAERSELVNSLYAAEIVQAINRIRCRKVVDVDGHCETCEVILLLPKDNHRNTTVIDKIKQQMPNIEIQFSDIDIKKAGKSGPSTDPTDQKFLNYVTTHTFNPAGEKPKYICDAADIMSRAKEGITKRLRDPKTKLYKDCAAIGVKIEGTGNLTKIVKITT